MEYTFEKPDLVTDFTSIGGGENYNADEFDADEWSEGAGWPTGNRVRREDADVVVESEDTFFGAIRRASDGETIYIPGDSEFTVSTVTVEVSADNVTVASGRGYDGDGALIKSNNRPNPLFRATGNGFRLTGIRFNFPETEPVEYENGSISKVVTIDGDGAEVDNCVFRGCGHAGIGVGFSRKVTDTHIHHNDMVDNPMGGLGYGVTVRRGEPLIQYNYFDNNRHSIASSGTPDSYYVARYNFQGPHGTSHCFDMHEHKLRYVDVEQLKERYDNFEELGLEEGDYIGGRRLSIHHNIMMHSDNEAVKIRAKPLEGGQINKNWLFHENAPEGTGSPGDAINLMRSKAASFDEEGLEINNNVYGEGGPGDIGIPRSGDGGEIPEDIQKLKEELEKQQQELAEKQEKVEEKEVVLEDERKKVEEWEKELEEREQQLQERNSSFRQFIDALKSLLGIPSNTEEDTSEK